MASELNSNGDVDVDFITIILSRMIKSPLEELVFKNLSHWDPNNTIIIVEHTIITMISHIITSRQAYSHSWSFNNLVYPYFNIFKE